MTRSRVFAGVALVAVVVASVFGVHEYQRARAVVDATRASLTRARATEAGTQTELDVLRQQAADNRSLQARSESSTKLERAEILRLAAETVKVHATSVHQHGALTVSGVARLQLAQTTQINQQCLDGEKSAMNAIAHHDQATAAKALNSALQQCASALAAAHGARFPYDFPDPFVLPVSDGYLAYSTNANGGNIEMIRSDDLVSWSVVGDALQGLPFWAAPGFTWGPSVMHVNAVPATLITPARPAQYVLYYTVHQAATGAQCVSSAVSPTPVGPFIDDSLGPLVCDNPDGGSIDPSPFVAPDGTMWLMWKRERAIRPAAIVSQQLGPDGRSFVGPQSDLLAADRSWEHGVVEAPSMVVNGTDYWLLFSGGVWSGRGYAQGVAHCAGPAGPCASTGRPVLATSGSTVSPGGGAAFVDGSGHMWLAYHAYTDPFVGWPSSRTLRLARIEFRPGLRIVPQ